jgi:hypothetical protein
METLRRNLSAKAKDSRSGLWNKVEDAAHEASPTPCNGTVVAQVFPSKAI